MIKKLRRKFIVVSLASVMAVLFIMMAVIFAFNYRSVVNRADSLAEIISTNRGRFPGGDKFRGKRPDFTPETPYETRFFTVTSDAQGNIKGTNSMAIKSVGSDDIADYAHRAMRKGDRGFLDNYRFLKKAEADGTLIVFVDCTRDLHMFQNFVLTGMLVCMLGLFLVFIAVFFLSKIALSPVETAMARQKRFITDASHELKTPLTVIDASIEVIEMEDGESKWTQNAKEQVLRLRDLCESLVELTRLDEKSGVREFEEFDMSTVTVGAALPFEASLEADGRKLVLDVPEGIKVKGNKKLLARLITLLADNAVKYSEGEGDVFVTLRRANGKTALEVINPSNVEEGEHPEFFERFWRKDQSRSKEKGFGIGLSTAKAISDEHRGKIYAESNGKFVRIRFIF